MVRAIELVKNGDASVLVSCGNTGALMAGGTLRLRMMEGVNRPALAAVIPRQGGHFILIDAGANPEAKPEHLVHNAILGSHYCRVMLGIAAPRVGLMTIGTEDGKGNALITETNEQLRRIGHIINYVGPIEGFQVFTDHVDVVVCDGFVGNVALKTSEGLARMIGGFIREEYGRSLLSRLAGLISLPVLGRLRRRLDHRRYNGASLVGLRGIVIKSHGSADALAFEQALRRAHDAARNRLLERIADAMTRLSAEPAKVGS